MFAFSVAGAAIAFAEQLFGQKLYCQWCIAYFTRFFSDWKNGKGPFYLRSRACPVGLPRGF